MRIASLVPSATEILFALGLGEQVVAVTHECDFPAPARELPHLTRTVIAPGLDAGEIDAEVKRITAEGQALYELDVDLLEGLQVDLILTQEVCRVCAVSYEDVLSIADRLPTRPAVLGRQREPEGGEVAGDRPFQQRALRTDPEAAPRQTCRQIGDQFVFRPHHEA